MFLRNIGIFLEPWILRYNFAKIGIIRGKFKCIFLGQGLVFQVSYFGILFWYNFWHILGIFFEYFDTFGIFSEYILENVVPRGEHGWLRREEWFRRALSCKEDGLVTIPIHFQHQRQPILLTFNMSIWIWVVLYIYISFPVYRLLLTWSQKCFYVIN